MMRKARPTDEESVNFDVVGPCVRWGEYNSGVPDSTNKMNLFTEGGINGIAIHSKRNARTIAIRA